MDKKVPTGKWVPPATNENNKRVIDGVPRFWLSKTKRWVNDRDATALVNHPPVANVVAVPSSDNTTMSSDSAGRELALSTAAHSINLTMQGFINTLKDT
jgi:hypothetical protein